jgi:hypothetical protein
MIKIILGLCVIVLISLGQATNSAQACSGYPLFGVDDLRSAQILVKAKVIETDDRGYSAELFIESYYKGEGPTILTVMRHPPALESIGTVRDYDTGCLYSGYGPPLVSGQEGYFGLRDNGNGTYTDYIDGTAHFYVINGQISYYTGITDGYLTKFDPPSIISEEEFIEKMLKAGTREQPIPPQPTQFYPLRRFLNVTTENGTRYQINPDRSLSPIADSAPLAISPDGAHHVFRLNDETLVFDYLKNKIAFTYPPGYHRGGYEKVTHREFESRSVKGQQALFSNDSSFVAVWDDEQLGIYLLGNEHRQTGSNGSMMIVHRVAELMLPETPKAVLWSADSSTLVWQDSWGVWHWNLFDTIKATRLDTSPLIGEQENFQGALLDVSTHGRYVRYGDVHEWWLIDTQTGENLPRLLVSPDERFLLSNENPDEYRTSPYCVPPLRDTCQQFYNYNDTINDTAPIWTNSLILTSCHDDPVMCQYAIVSWHPAIHHIGYTLRYRNILDARQIIVDPQYNRPAVLMGDYIVAFNFYHDFDRSRTNLDIVDLEGMVDSPIASIEWGQPVFYEWRLFVMTDYMP